MKKLWINETEYIFFKENKKRLSDEIATRKRSFDFYSLGFNLPDPDPILKEQGKDIRIYRELLSDSHVWACVQSRKSGILSLEWELNRGKARSRQVKIIENIFNQLDLTTIISEILDASMFGFQPLEIIWQKAGELIIPREIKAKPVEWFVFDDENNLKLKTKEKRLGEFLPDRKFLCPQYNPSYQNPYGERTLSRSFWSVVFKKGGMRFWALFTEKYGMPFLVGKHPRGASKDDTESLADLLSSMVQDAIAVIPDDSSVEILEGSKNSSAEIYEKLIDKMNAEISKAILGQTLTTEIGSTGSYAASNTHMDVRKDIIDSDKKLVEKTLNQLIKWIYEINFTSEQVPVFELYEEEDVDLALSQRDEILTKTGVKFTKEYFIKTYGFEDEDIEVINEIKEKPQDNSFKQFAQANINGQEEIDELVSVFDSDSLSKQSKIILKPILSLFYESESFEEVYEKLSNVQVNSKQFEEEMAKALFLAKAWGLIDAEYE